MPTNQLITEEAERAHDALASKAEARRERLGLSSAASAQEGETPR